MKPIKSMEYVECPNKALSNKPSLFLGGGISECHDWQKNVISHLYPLDIILYNPKRASFNINDKDMSEEQIVWEEEMIRASDVVSFYFCRETLCPIALYELGTCNMTSKPLIVGMDATYQRRFDVTLQTLLKRPDAIIVCGIENYTLKLVSTMQERCRT